MRTFAAIAAIVFSIVLLGTGTPAAAADPKPIGTIVPSKGADPNFGGGGRWCDIYTNPYPQYSASNRTMHFGGKIICNYTDSLVVIATLYRVVGSGSNTDYIWASNITTNAIGQEHGNTTYDACIGSTPTRFILKVEASALTLGQGWGWSPVYTYPCADVV
jgi:hypothetical protein